MSSENWKELIESEPDNELVRFSLGKALMDEKNFKAAVPHFEKLVKLDPEYAIAWAFLARCALNSGDKEKARWACEQGMPVTRRQKHETPETEMQAVIDELDSEF